MASELLALARQYRTQLDKQDAAALNRIINAYTALFSRLQDKITLLSDAVGDGEMTRAQAERSDRYKSLIAQTASELNKFSNYVESDLSAAARAAIDLAIKHSAGLMAAAADGAGVEASFNRLPKAAIETLLGFLQPDSPLFKRLAQLAPYTTQRMADALLEGIGLGYNPRKTADIITNTLGMGLTDALRMTRTAQLYTYREATRANYVANGDVVQGWVWYAELDESVCLSCAAQHGTEHGLDEILNDHHNGRCAMIPQVGDNPVSESGQEWFDNLPEAQQRGMMGPGKHAAYQDGAFDFEDLSTESDDEVYGPMRSEASLAELVG